MAESNTQVVRWDEEHQRSYVLQYVNGQWTFLRWLDKPRADSFVRPPLPPSRGEGLPIEGTYTAANPQSFETLDQSFYVRPSSFFQEGRVFAVLFTEPAGQNAKPTDYNTSFSYVKFQELVYSQIRRFIVVSQRREFCFAVPIFTYGNQGTLKHGVRPEEHAIAYSYGCQPSLLQGEVQLPKHPICVVMNQGEPALSIASRIYFAIHHPIQYNVKVKNLGSVHPDDVPRLRGYWSMENGDLSNQPSMPMTCA